MGSRKSWGKGQYHEGRQRGSSLRVLPFIPLGISKPKPTTYSKTEREKKEKRKKKKHLWSYRQLQKMENTHTHKNKPHKHTHKIQTVSRAPHPQHQSVFLLSFLPLVLPGHLSI